MLNEISKSGCMPHMTKIINQYILCISLEDMYKYVIFKIKKPHTPLVLCVIKFGWLWPHFLFPRLKGNKTDAVRRVKIVNFVSDRLDAEIFLITDWTLLIKVYLAMILIWLWIKSKRVHWMTQSCLIKPKTDIHKINI